MTKRVKKPIYSHNGFALRPVKVLSNGAELLHCVERKTRIQCGAVGRRETDGTITISKEHGGHTADEDKIKAKLARIDIKEMAKNSTLAPRHILLMTRIMYGDLPVAEAGSVSTLNRMINRERGHN